MPVKNIIPGQHVTKEKLQRAKELRREMTSAEKPRSVWQEVRAKKLGVRFRRHTCPGVRCQGQIIAGFIVDFYCHKAALVVEVDGDIHDLHQEEDARREKALREMGLKILRFRNDEILKELSTVLAAALYRYPAQGIWQIYSAGQLPGLPAPLLGMVQRPDPRDREGDVHGDSGGHHSDQLRGGQSQCSHRDGSVERGEAARLPARL
jgi:very-short-patch-repair endonuclease